MAPYKFTPLSAQDMDFLAWETPCLPMHGSGVQTFASGALATSDGGIDFARIERAYAAVMHRVPRYRQKLAWMPGERRAVWVDDPHFHLGYHMRHTALPRPGSEAQLKRLAARIMEHPLDRSRPLWEVWVVEGLEGDRFALISKTHHCILDGESSVDILQLILSRTPDWEIPEAPRYLPRPEPSAGELRAAALRHAAKLPLRALGELRSFLERTEHPLQEVAARVRSLGELARWKVQPASETPLNGPVGPHRIFDWLELSLDEVRAIRKARGASVNDVVLAVVTGALREFLVSRGARPERLDFRVSTPVNVRSEQERGRLGNRVSAWVLRLPIDRRSPLEQLDAIHASTQHLKDSHQSAAMEMVTALHEWIPIDIQAAQRGTINLFVTNVPGPQFPMYLLGSEMLGLYAQAPLIENLGLVIAVVSYNGRLCFGFNADSDRVPDLGSFVSMMRASFVRLAEAAG